MTTGIFQTLTWCRWRFRLERILSCCARVAGIGVGEAGAVYLRLWYPRVRRRHPDLQQSLVGVFDACVKLYPHPKTVSNWVMGELLRELNHAGIEADASPVTPERLVELPTLVDQAL